MLSRRLTPACKTDTRFRSLAAVSRDVEWVGGSKRGGHADRSRWQDWISIGQAGAEGLQFRDIEATSADHAVAMSAGEGTDSRIYVTDNGVPQH